VLNRPVFTQRAFDSSSLTVLTTLFHHFPEAGDYDLVVRRGERVIHRTQVRIVAENAPQQINVDLATLGDAETCGPLGADSVMGFYVSQGTGQYAVTIRQLAAREKRTLLDSSAVVPEGDFFAITLVRPGIYRVLNKEGKGAGTIHVSLPKGKKYRVDQATLVKIGKQGMFKPRAVRILAGQTVVFQCTAPARIHAELAKAEGTSEKPIERRRYTLRKRPTKADTK
jgi:hypothetical protein